SLLLPQPARRIVLRTLVAGSSIEKAWTMGAKDTSIAAQGGFDPAGEAGREARDTGVAPGGELDVIEIAGAIKWFDAGKGFGFIVPDAGGPDVLLHVTCLRRDGYQTAYEGARIVVEALNRP